MKLIKRMKLAITLLILPILLPGGIRAMETTPMEKANILEDRETILKNPAMGWNLYIDTVGGRNDVGDSIPDADTYWKLVEDAVPYSSILYLRISWAELEPEKGRYAWIYDDNFIRLIQGAKERGLKLGFCIYYLSQDAAGQATPEYVRQAGAQGHELFTLGAAGLHQKAWSPYEYDPVFQSNFEVFLQEFAKEFDNPDICDYMNGINFGFWGETHWQQYSANKDTDSTGMYTKAQKDQMYDWALNLYSSTIQNVLLMDDSSDFGFDFSYRRKALEKGYQMRRCSIGSKWFWPQEKAFVNENWPQYAFFAENAFHHFFEQWWNNTDAGINGYTTSQMLQAVHDDAIAHHANTLELRIPMDVDTWLVLREDLVRNFALKGGYRVSPTDFAYPAKVGKGDTFQVVHSWQNIGVGKIPNNNSNWKGKFKLAVACLDKKTGLPVTQTIVKNYELGELIQENPSGYLTNTVPAPAQSGLYDIAVAIVDTSSRNLPGIQLALKNERKNGWYVLGELEVTEDSIGATGQPGAGEELIPSVDPEPYYTTAAPAEPTAGLPSNSGVNPPEKNSASTAIWIILGIGGLLLLAEAMVVLAVKWKKSDQSKKQR